LLDPLKQLRVAFFQLLDALLEGFHIPAHRLRGG
jgi:hypothetical protein